MVGRKGELDGETLRRILSAGSYLISQDSPGTLRLLLDSWLTNESNGIHALGPSPWRGVQGAADYMKTLEDIKFARSVGGRISRLLFFLNYMELTKQEQEAHFQKHLPEVKSIVIGRIADAYYGSPGQRTTSQPDNKVKHDKVNGYVRWARWWWKLAGTLGIGVVLVCDRQLMSAMTSGKFTNSTIDAFVTYAIYTRPGTVRLLKLLEPAARQLMFGHVSSGLIDAIRNDEFGLLGRTQLSNTYAEDGKALTRKQVDSSWPTIDSEQAALDKVTEVLKLVPHDEDKSLLDLNSDCTTSFDNRGFNLS
ncbi:hypothetical protein EYZ11_010187 [Aspergillus tanneri]|uniref:Uncharacterized protein n=1 Tax=Aspergillus tanneri TaxID=1220188 RepID=A0A4S3J606_9EURO|nr:hypothetical protein EYZ11_010187 [Aspergillus tanneri]